MSKPAIIPDKTTAGIAVDPRTLQRVVPESRRPDGTVRKEIKIRPGFTPQEDVKRFRGTRQAQMDVNALPKGHIIGWAPPSSSTAKPGAGAAGTGAAGAGAAGGGSATKSKAAKKNEKRKEKRAQKRDEAVASPSDPVRDDWEDEDDEEDASKSNTPGKTVAASSAAAAGNAGENADKDKAKSSGSQDKDVSGLTDKIEKLAV